MKYLPEETEMPEDRNLNVVAEINLPICYGCGQKGHIKNKCPLNMTLDTEEVKR